MPKKRGSDAKRHHFSDSPDRGQILIAQLAAKLMFSEGITDFRDAKESAARQLHLLQSRLPDNQAIQVALESYIATFGDAAYAEHHENMLAISRKALTLLAPFEPKLIGALTRGTPGYHCPIEILTHADSVETVARYFIEMHVPYRLSESTRQVGRNKEHVFSMLIFFADEQEIRVIVLASDEHLHPLDPLTGGRI